MKNWKKIGLLAILVLAIAYIWDKSKKKKEEAKKKSEKNASLIYTKTGKKESEIVSTIQTVSNDVNDEISTPVVMVSGDSVPEGTNDSGQVVSAPLMGVMSNANEDIVQGYTLSV